MGFSSVAQLHNGATVAIHILYTGMCFITDFVFTFSSAICHASLRSVFNTG